MEKGINMAKNKSLSEQAEEILAKAEAKGLTTNFFFATTFRRYTVQMKILNDLQKEIEKEGPSVTKEYVKGRKNVYTNPAITEYNKTATAANNTVMTLIKIVNSLAEEDSGGASLADKMANLLGDE